MLGLSISNVWQSHAECFSRLLIYAYGRAPVAGPGPHTDTAATGGWRVESVGGGEVGLGLVSGSSWCEEECPALAQRCPTLPCWTARGGELRPAHGNFSLRLWLEQ